MDLSEESANSSDEELQEAFASGKLKPGLNLPAAAPKQFTNNVSGLKNKLREFKLDLPWIESLDCVNKQAPLAPELAAQLLINEEKRENQLKNNKKLQKFEKNEDPVLNDFKRETLFHRQAQATVTEAIPRIAQMGIATTRPDDYFAEMAKTDDHMQKIRTHLMQKQVQKQRSEKVKQLREQKKHGKMLQVQAKLDRQKEKKVMLDQVKKVRKGHSKDLDFLDGKKSKRSVEKRKMRDKKFGFGGKKKGSKINSRESAADISEYRRPNRGGKGTKGGKNVKNRPGKNRRVQAKSRGKNK